jgi:hypothetical protein
VPARRGPLRGPRRQARCAGGSWTCAAPVRLRRWGRPGVGLDSGGSGRVGRRPYPRRRALPGGAGPGAWSATRGECPHRLFRRHRAPPAATTGGCELHSYCRAAHSGVAADEPVVVVGGRRRSGPPWRSADRSRGNSDGRSRRVRRSDRHGSSPQLRFVPVHVRRRKCARVAAGGGQSHRVAALLHGRPRGGCHVGCPDADPLGGLPSSFCVGLGRFPGSLGSRCAGYRPRRCRSPSARHPALPLALRGVGGRLALGRFRRLWQTASRLVGPGQSHWR